MMTAALRPVGWLIAAVRRWFIVQPLSLPQHLTFIPSLMIQWLLFSSDSLFDVQVGVAGVVAVLCHL